MNTHRLGLKPPSARGNRAYRFETPSLRYWRVLNDALAKLGAHPVAFGEALALRASYADAMRAADFVAHCQACGG